MVRSYILKRNPVWPGSRCRPPSLKTHSSAGGRQTPEGSGWTPSWPQEWHSLSDGEEEERRTKYEQWQGRQRGWGEEEGDRKWGGKTKGEEMMGREKENKLSLSVWGVHKQTSVKSMVLDCKAPFPPVNIVYSWWSDCNHSEPFLFQDEFVFYESDWEKNRSNKNTWKSIDKICVILIIWAQEWTWGLECMPNTVQPYWERNYYMNSKTN